MGARTRYGFALAIFAFAVHGPAAADGIVRRQAGTFPIASTVSIPAGAEIVYVSGTLADPVKPDAPAGSAEQFGDTETQAASVLAKLAKALEGAGMGLGDVVKMNVFLVGDPARGGRMDFDGLMRAYSKHFGTDAQKNLPVRTTVQVAALPLPGALVEIEVVAAKAAAR